MKYLLICRLLLVRLFDLFTFSGCTAHWLLSPSKPGHDLCGKRQQRDTGVDQCRSRIFKFTPALTFID